MIIDELSIRSFRAHASTTVRFAEKVNALCGPNGSGKTNLLEAMHYLCLSKSFITSSDAYALRKGDELFEVRGRFRFVARAPAGVRLVYTRGEGKRMFVNGAPLEKFSEIVGRFPVVVVSPDDHVLTAGAPEERRRFLDNILSQTHPLYLSDLLTYRRALKQRNALLREAGGRRPDAARLGPWTEQLVKTGAKLVVRRALFLERFSGYLDEAHSTIETVAERPTITYRTLVRPGQAHNDLSVSDEFRERLADAEEREVEQGRTVIGPHRDELVFRLDDLEARRYASQGQHRTLVLALKLAQLFYMQEVSDEPPLLLMDDVLDNLDPTRREAILQLLRSDQVGQSIVTAADTRVFGTDVDFSTEDHSLIRIHPETRVTLE